MTPDPLPVDPRNVEEVIRSLRTVPDLEVEDDGRGIRILADEPDLYNKWLFTWPAADGSHRVFSLSRRFCPFDNMFYAGGSPYHTGLRAERNLFPVLIGFGRTLHNLTPDRVPDRWFIRGPWGPHPQDSEWHTRGQPPRVVLEQDADGEVVRRERRRTRWDGPAGPVWTDEETGLSVRLAMVPDAGYVHAAQNAINLDLGFRDINWVSMRGGILTLLGWHHRHNCLTMFTRGAFVVAIRDGRRVGCAWTYRSFDPMRAGWTIWVRRAYVSTDGRRRGVFHALHQSVLGLLAEAGYRTRLRVLVPDGSPLVSRLERQGFRRTEAYYLN